MRRKAATGLVLLAGIALVSAAAAQGRRSGTRLFERPGSRPLRIGATPAPLTSVDASECGRCHEAEHRAWRGSAHARSWSGSFFQAGYRADPYPFCRNCHAPLSPTNADPTGIAADDGVSCAVCHVRGGRILALETSEAGRRVHAMRREPQLASSAYCGECHQFHFPDRQAIDRVGHAPDEWMQSTLSEWRASGVEQSCQECHMRTDAGLSTHSLRGLDDRAMMRRAVRVTVDAARAADGSVAVEARLEAGSIGHAFPTGDVLRRAELRVWPAGRPGEAQTAVFTRTFGHTRERHRGRWREVIRGRADERIPAPGQGALERSFSFAGVTPGRIRWGLSHLRMSARGAHALGFPEARNRLEIVGGSAPVRPR